MDRRERMNDRTESFRTMLDGRQAHIWTAMPALIQSVDWEKMTCVAQPTIKGEQLLQDGTFTQPAMPLCLDVPVMFPNGGGYSLTFPVKEGDECLLIFASRCIDAWWQSGGVQQQQELRMHDLSDGFALVGPRSVPRALTDISAENVQLRSDDGTIFVELATDQVTLRHPTKIIIDAPEAHFTGKITVEGEIVADGEVTGNDIKLSDHGHEEVETGTDTSGAPVNL